MKGEESPDVSRKSDGEVKIFQQISCTPKGKKVSLDDLHLLGLHRDCSPNAYGSSQDNLEVGWGDSPEPLKIKEKPVLEKTSMACKKLLDPSESPKSRYKNARPSQRAPSKPPVDIAKYIAEVQALSKSIMDKLKNEKQLNPASELDIDNSLNDELTNECLLACSQALERKLGASNSCSSNSSSDSCYSSRVSNQDQSSISNMSSSQNLSSDSNANGQSSSQSDDSAFEKALERFISEEDDWLSEVILNAEANATTPRKSNFLKTKSENQLTSPGVSYRSGIPLARKSHSDMRGNFRRTHSTDRICSSEYARPHCSTSGKTVERKTRNNVNIKRQFPFSDKPKVAHENVRKGFG